MENEHEVLKKIGEKLKRLRLEKGFTSYETFAIEHDISRMQYWRIEKGLSNITIKTLLKLLTIHNLTIDDFFSSE